MCVHYNNIISTCIWEEYRPKQYKLDVLTEMMVLILNVL